MKSPVTPVLLIAGGMLSHASAAPPFLGGAGDGHAAMVRENHPMDGTTPPAVAFGGGSGDGFAGVALENHPFGPSTPAIVQSAFLGGAADGFAGGSGLNRPFGPPPDPLWDAPALAGPGGGDGFAAARAENLTVTAPPPVEPYRAGPGGGDGFAAATLENRLLGPAADPAWAILATATAAGADGFAAGTLTNHPFGPPALPAESIIAFAGAGGGDGFAASALTLFPLASAAFPMVAYFGGPAGGDGFAGSSLWNRPLGGAALPSVLFAGGPADGFDHRVLTNVELRFQLASPVVWNTFQAAVFPPADVSSGLAAPAADADGDGVPNLLEFALGTDPKAPGGSAGINAPLANPADYGWPDPGQRYLTFDIPRSPFALGVALGAEFSSSLTAGTWNPAAVPLLNQPARLILRDPLPASAQPARFGRVTAALTP
jgi:hypothetical protein